MNAAMTKRSDMAKSVVCATEGFNDPDPFVVQDPAGISHNPTEALGSLARLMA